jgi:hypothetical protein
VKVLARVCACVLVLVMTEGMERIGRKRHFTGFLLTQDACECGCVGEFENDV